MASMKTTAKEFFDACETGKGWAGCQQYCHPAATFSAQAAALTGVNTVTAYAVFRGTHTGEGGPVPPTGKRVEADYVYSMQFDGDRIRHMTKIWNDGITMQQLGWM
jgi:predicted ester cyclase